MSTLSDVGIGGEECSGRNVVKNCNQFINEKLGAKLDTALGETELLL